MDGLMVVIVVSALLFGIPCAAIAQARGAGVGGWFLVGAMLGLIGLVMAVAIIPQPVGPVAGWFADPTGAPRLRWFDGYRWTEHVR